MIIKGVKIINIKILKMGKAKKTKTLGINENKYKGGAIHKRIT
jgi:hypothetical protein